MKEFLRFFAETATAGFKVKLPSGSVTPAKIMNPIFYFIGILAVIMIIYGGIQYATSAGDAGKVAKAKNILIWSIAGLALAILAYAIVNFVIVRLG